MQLNYEELGLKVGLEIHQQLDTKHKLFCSCSPKLVDDEGPRFIRYLRPTRSEVGDVDVAALFEWRKGRHYEYVATTNTCLVEADEEPPHEINREALLVALGVAMTLNARIVDEIYVMRKIVIDGSNTSGFQRTALIALGGSIRVGGKTIPIETIVLEEDAARKEGEEGAKVKYKLDRLGIPLIEIATAPVIKTPQEAKEVALAIGRLLRLTGKVKRGIGTIRQDLNISIRGGAKTEIKGVQKLELIPKVIEYEVLRQLRLLEIRDELLRRGISRDDLKEEFIDVTEVFKNTKSRVIKKVLRSGGRVIAVKLKGFKGLLGKELMPGRRFGTELADYARFWSGVGGLFHTDELPGYGISSDEVNKLYKVVGADPDRDAIVIIAEREERAIKGLKAVVERARAALEGVPEETRAANDDGTTRFLRPRPGSARMYPETDIPPVEVTEELLKEAMKYRVEPLEVKLEKLVKVYGLPRDLAVEVLNDLRLDTIERLLAKYKGRLPASFIASLFVVTLRGLKGEGVDVDAIDDDKIEALLEAIASGKVAKEAAADILKYVAENPEATVNDAIKALGLEAVSIEYAEALVDEVIRDNIEVVKSRGVKAMGLIMGKVMSKLRGRIDGRIVADIVKRKIREVIGDQL